MNYVPRPVTPIIKPEPIAEAYFNSRKMEAGLHTELFIYNALGRPLTIADRTGVTYFIQPGWEYGDRAIYVQRVTELSRDTIAYKGLGQPASDPKSPSPADVIIDSLRQIEVNQPYGRQRRTRVFFKIPEKHLVQAGGTMYVPELDMMLSINQDHRELAHPFTVTGMLNEFKQINALQQGLNLSILIVDNLMCRGDRYVSLFGGTYKVPRFEMPGKPDGVYICHPHPVVAGGVDTEYTSRFMTLEEAEAELGLYKTIEEAQTHGFSKEALERENLKLKREATQEAHRQSQLNAERVERQADRKERMTEEEEIRERNKQFRSDVIEIFKFIAAVIGAGVTLLSLVSKFKGEAKK